MPSKVPPPILIENSGPSPATGSEPIYRDGGATEMPNVHCGLWGNFKPPAQSVPDVLEVWARRRAGQPRAVKFVWSMIRTADAVSSEDYKRPGPAQIIDGFRRGTLNIDRRDPDGQSDLSALSPFGSGLEASGEYADLIHINDESTSGAWAYGKGDASDQRNTEIILSVMKDDRCRAALSPVLQSIPKDDAEIKEAFTQPFGDPIAYDLFEVRQAAWLARWNIIRMRSIRSLLVRSGLLVRSSQRVYVSFTGNWPGFPLDDNGHRIACTPMPTNLRPNWQCYQDGPQARMRASLMAMAPGAMLTFWGDHSAREIDGYLQHAAPNGAILYTTEGPAKLDHLVDAVSRIAA